MLSCIGSQAASYQDRKNSPSHLASPWYLPSALDQDVPHLGSTTADHDSVYEQQIVDSNLHPNRQSGEKSMKEDNRGGSFFVGSVVWYAKSHALLA